MRLGGSVSQFSGDFPQFRRLIWSLSCRQRGEAAHVINAIFRSEDLRSINVMMKGLKNRS